MLRVPGVNFRNALLCLAIVLQLLTFLKHTGTSIINLPGSLPIGSTVETAKSEPTKRTRTERSTNRTRAHGNGTTPTSLISSAQPQSGLSLSGEGSPASSGPAPGQSGKSTLHSAAPMDSGGGGAPGTPTVANPNPGRSTPSPINTGSSEPSFAKTEPPADAGSSDSGGPEPIDRGDPPENSGTDPGADAGPLLVIE